MPGGRGSRSACAPAWEPSTLGWVLLVVQQLLRPLPERAMAAARVPLLR